ncbi:MAG: hypothetical protein WKG52_01060 [Variovorax sp.]
MPLHQVGWSELDSGLVKYEHRDWTKPHPFPKHAEKRLPNLPQNKPLATMTTTDIGKWRGSST